jgi:hypothetical protein
VLSHMAKPSTTDPSRVNVELLVRSGDSASYQV